MTDSADLQTLLEQHQRPWWKRATTWIVLAALALAAGGWWLWQDHSRAAAAPRYVTQPVTRGNLAISITATGTLQPTRSVAVGSELSGTVTRVLVDVNDRVKKGQLLVELDRAKLQDSVNASRAALQSARATQTQAEATLRESKASLARLVEVQRLSGGKLPAATELDTARATADRAAAAQAVAVAGVAQAAAALATNETNLSKAAIRSPIDGVVLARNVEPGYAVAASLQAVTLFTLAEDLASMKLSVNVDEADVAQLKNGQRARFTVASQPGRDFAAVVSRVAFGSTTTDNVVTYTTQLDVDNSDLVLRPGMTATATIATTERSGVLLVPNSALRFTPTGGDAAAPARGGSGASEPAAAGGILSKLMPRPPGMNRPRRAGGNAPGGAAANVPREGTVWVLRDGQAVAVAVQRGLSDGRQTEVSGPGLAEGMAVIVDQSSAPK
ncbi:MAG: efflux RND transporter periplasmic adaptor subunit [Proteobacteria bacterium]|nr:efflux RND transporter periplasmic adaptor subunit [Pseudomonadota bacterium]